MLLTLQVRASELLLKNKPTCLNFANHQRHLHICLSPSVPPVISVSHPEEEVEVDVEEGGENEEDSEPSQIGDEEPSTSVEHTKQEVRNSTYEITASISHAGFNKLKLFYFAKYHFGYAYKLYFT